MSFTNPQLRQHRSNTMSLSSAECAAKIKHGPAGIVRVRSPADLKDSDFTMDELQRLDVMYRSNTMSHPLCAHMRLGADLSVDGNKKRRYHTLFSNEEIAHLKAMCAQFSCLFHDVIPIINAEGSRNIINLTAILLNPLNDTTHPYRARCPGHCRHSPFIAIQNIFIFF